MQSDKPLTLPCYNYWTQLASYNVYMQNGYVQKQCSLRWNCVVSYASKDITMIGISYCNHWHTSSSLVRLFITKPTNGYRKFIESVLVTLQIIWTVNNPLTVYAVLPILTLITPFLTETGCDTSSSNIAKWLYIRSHSYI